MARNSESDSSAGNRSDGGNKVEDRGRKRTPKHQVVFEYLHGRITSGEFKPGDRLPSEAELCKMFDASRITAAKAVLELQRLDLVTRRPGAGTHVKLQPQLEGRTFGLLIPELGLTEIFEPVCHGMARSAFARPHTLVWGSASGSEGANSHRESAELAEQMAHRFIAQNLSGVFFAPLELISDSEAANRRIVRSLERARVPVVLLDRCYLPYPERSSHDLVGIDNRCTGFKITDHLLRLGVTRLAFLGEEHAAQTVDARLTGFFEALRVHGIRPDGEWAWRGSPTDRSFAVRMLEKCRPQGVVCANDVTAARLMQTLLALGYRIPEDIRIVGIDDVKYASLLPVPLTTIHQNCAALGAVAMATMLDRVAHPELPVRDVLVPTRLVVRSSCGAQSTSSAINQ
ncbi:GntR family transcriptional regulator [Acidicapsa dinghuensis]|uniref:GntR family transcriptional regulator n=1 Tax=Acidicapsa dinghuensis TaxID=2218256 RepID=A0ABW1EG09_9BACT|nr:GntR family transcriptional regulator [Acidicapsa dinghuensis]